MNRLAINEYPQGVEIVISARRSPFLNVFLIAWMLAWTYGELEIINRLIEHKGNSPDAFIVFWACGWTLSGFLAAFIWVWNMKGEELIRVSDDELLRYRNYALFARSRTYRTELISNLRLTELNPASVEMSGGMEFWGLAGGAISFDYGSGVQKFGLGIGESQASEIIMAINSRFDFNQA
jgi:hypothetical protein